MNYLLSECEVYTVKRRRVPTHDNGFSLQMTNINDESVTSLAFRSSGNFRTQQKPIEQTNAQCVKSEYQGS